MPLRETMIVSASYFSNYSRQWFSQQGIKNKKEVSFYSYSNIDLYGDDFFADEDELLP